MRRTAVLLAALLTYGAPVGAESTWQEARLLRQRATDDPAVTRCFYRVTNSIRMTTVLIGGNCPRRIEINFEVREWRIP